MKKQHLIILFLSLFVTPFYSQSLIVNPNPFTNRTLANYTIANSDTATLIVINLTGATAVTIYSNTYKPAGNYQDSIIMDAFPAGVYYVQLRFKHNTSLITKIVKTAPVALQENQFFSGIKLYPNPVKDNLYIDLEMIETQKIKLSISNNLGQVLYSLNNPNPQEEIDLSFLVNGIYYLKILSNGGQKVFKVVKE